MAETGAVLTNAGGAPGHALVLTKPLGIGIIITAIKRGKCPPGVAKAAIEAMTTLNALAASTLHDWGAAAVTDVTGFGLLGHLKEMCLASGVGARVELDAVPILEGALDLLAMGMWAGGSQRNYEATSAMVESARDPGSLRPLFDAQTSGGLLVALPADTADAYAASVDGSVVIGVLTGTGHIEVV
jgi:selenide,water dikinase